MEIFPDCPSPSRGRPDSGEPAREAERRPGCRPPARKTNRRPFLSQGGTSPVAQRTLPVILPITRKQLQRFVSQRAIA